MGEAKRRRDNPDLARQFADKDRARAWNELSRMCQDCATTAQFIEYGTPGYDVSAVDKETFAPIEAAADVFRKVIPRAGPGCVYLHIAGATMKAKEMLPGDDFTLKLASRVMTVAVHRCQGLSSSLPGKFAGSMDGLRRVSISEEKGNKNGKRPHPFNARRSTA